MAQINRADGKRELIQLRILQAQVRNQGRRELSLAKQIEKQAIEAKTKLVDFAKQHPVATVAGGIVVGIAVTAILSGPRRAAILSAPRAINAIDFGSKIAYALANQLIDKLQNHEADAAGKFANLENIARGLQSDALDRFFTARDVMQDFGRTAVKSMSGVLKRD